MTEHPITPSPELLQEWRWQGRNCISELDALKELATQAARWGADQQLEMDADWVQLQMSNQMSAKRLIAEMRPKPPSLKEQALEALNQADKGLTESEWQQRSDTIRRALEQLDD